MATVRESEPQSAARTADPKMANAATAAPAAPAARIPTSNMFPATVSTKAPSGGTVRERGSRSGEVETVTLRR